MAVSQLPIYNHTRQFIEEYIRVYERIKKLHKYHIGSYIYDKALLLPMLIKKADRAKEDAAVRISFLEDYLDELECVGNGIRIAMDVSVIDHKAHARLSEQLVGLTKEATAWKGKTEARVQNITNVQERCVL